MQICHLNSKRTSLLAPTVLARECLRAVLLVEVHQIWVSRGSKTLLFFVKIFVLLGMLAVI